MEIWFLQDMQRFSHERDAIQRLEASTDWLTGVNWTLNGGSLCVEAIIRAHEHEYPIKMTYPPLFPSVPLIVCPKNPSERWTSHQYNDGTLCLEWGPDTWHPDVTGAQVLESTHRLFDIENPLGSARDVIAPSRHQLSTGQTLRNSIGRFFVSNKLTNYLGSLPIPSSGSLELSVQVQSRSFIVFCQQVHPSGSTVWEDTSIPKGVCASKKNKGLRKGVFYKTDLKADYIDTITNASEAERALEQAGYGSVSLTRDEESYAMGLQEPPFAILLLDIENEPHPMLLLDTEDNTVVRLTSVESETTGVNARIPADFRELSCKTVGIVGIGSVGSSIALSLARTGLSRFLLVDDDVFLPENVCRHSLDWQNVGEHKVDAVAAIISRIAPDINVDVSRLNLTGQESTASLSAVLSKLGECDLIIDATANPRVFNITAAVASTSGRPMVWAEVYAGGIGGMIARSRPEHDPDPYTMRAAYHHFTSETPPYDFSVSEDYTAETPRGVIVTASDADVNVLAYNAARLAIDTLLGREPPTFPYSMYLIGLARSWIFEEPFHTIPIDTKHLVGQKDPKAVSKEVLSESLEFLSTLLKGESTEDTSTQGD